MTTELIKQKITDLKLCVLIPTYNNERTLNRVIDGVLKYTDHIIVVNDGATDGSETILKTYPNIQQIHFPKNKGKGLALRTGFNQAVSLGYDFAISIDSDGQHFPDEIPVFIKALEEETTKNVLLIGARNMDQEGVPKKSSFGHKFSNFWFWYETGSKRLDTQSGCRLYPLQQLKNLNFYTTKFEFEIEVIVKAAWKGIKVKNVPIHVLYDETERVSHFRPFKDFTRISILNTWFVILTIFYIKPRDFFRRLKKKGIKRFFIEDLLGSYDTPRKKALSIALGVFIGVSPFWGFQSVLVIFLAIVFKLNKTIAFAFSNISLPPVIPFIIYGSLKMGQFILGESVSYSIAELTENFEVYKHLKTYIVGSFCLAMLLAILFGLFSYLFLLLFQKKKIAITNV